MVLLVYTATAVILLIMIVISFSNYEFSFQIFIHAYLAYVNVELIAITELIAYIFLLHNLHKRFTTLNTLLRF